jgi:hypothetical protein
MREEFSSLGCSLHAMPFLLSWVCGSLFDGLMGHLGMFLALCFGGLRSHVCHERQKELYLSQWKKAGNKQSQVTHQKPSIIRSWLWSVSLVANYRNHVIIRIRSCPKSSATSFSATSQWDQDAALTTTHEGLMGACMLWWMCMAEDEKPRALVVPLSLMQPYSSLPLLEV